MSEESPSSWAIGWAFFAAVMLMIAGMFQAIAGVAAVFTDDFYVVGREWTLSFDVTAWGRAHIILGVVLILVGAGVLTGNILARTIGVIIAAISAVANFAFIPYYPVWSMALIAVDVAIIWALTAHGRDVQAV